LTCLKYVLALGFLPVTVTWSALITTTKAPMSIDGL
jgi:hypothetical protein